MQDRIVRTLLQLKNRAVHVCTHADNLDMYQVVILIFHFVLRLETETGKFIFIVCSLRLAQGLASDFFPMNSKCDHRADRPRY